MLRARRRSRRVEASPLRGPDDEGILGVLPPGPERCNGNLVRAEEETQVRDGDCGGVTGHGLFAGGRGDKLSASEAAPASGTPQQGGRVPRDVGRVPS